MKRAAVTRHNHRDCIDRALRTAERLCLERGARLTSSRRLVLELIWHGHVAVKAYDLLDQLKSFDPSAKPATVYRALEFLMEQGLIHRVESLNAFIGCSDVESQHESFLLICDRCSCVEERSAVGVMEAIAGEIHQAAFLPRQQTLEVRGLCRDCAALS